MIGWKENVIHKLTNVSINLQIDDDESDVQSFRAINARQWFDERKMNHTDQCEIKAKKLILKKNKKKKMRKAIRDIAMNSFAYDECEWERKKERESVKMSSKNK